MFILARRTIWRAFLPGRDLSVVDAINLEESFDELLRTNGKRSEMIKKKFRLTTSIFAEVTGRPISMVFLASRVFVTLSS